MADWKDLERRRGSAVPYLGPLSDSESFHDWLRQAERRAVGRGCRWSKAWPLVGRADLRAGFDAGLGPDWAVGRVISAYLGMQRTFDAPLV
jgi:hypothetical protein